MSKKNREDEKTHKVQEYRNKKWRDFLIDDLSQKKDKEGNFPEVVKTAKISEEQAEELNKDSNSSGIRYVLSDKKDKSKKDKDSDQSQETPMQKAIRLKSEIQAAETAEAVDALAKDGTPAVLKAADERKAELAQS